MIVNKFNSLACLFICVRLHTWLGLAEMLFPLRAGRQRFYLRWLVNHFLEGNVERPSKVQLWQAISLPSLIVDVMGCAWTTKISFFSGCYFARLKPPQHRKWIFLDLFRPIVRHHKRTLVCFVSWSFSHYNSFSLLLFGSIKVLFRFSLLPHICVNEAERRRLCSKYEKSRVSLWKHHKKRQKRRRRKSLIYPMSDSFYHKLRFWLIPTFSKRARHEKG